MISDTILYRLLGEKLREVRQRRRITQEQLGKLVDLERTSISNIEAGNQRMPVHVLYALCEALGQEPAELIPRLTETRGEPEWASVLVGGVKQPVPASLADFLEKRYRMSRG